MRNRLDALKRDRMAHEKSRRRLRDAGRERLNEAEATAMTEMGGPDPTVPATPAGPASDAAGAGAAVASASAAVADWVRLLRPRQWFKNAFVLAPLVFSGRLLDMEAGAPAFLAFAAFCVLASGVYAWNDVFDREADRLHPVKRDRPVAAGRISPGAAGVAGSLLLAAGLVLATSVGVAVGLTAVAYVGLNVIYSARLKRVVIVDVFCLAAFFVLRLLAGAAAIEVEPSVWLLLCGGLLALYLGFAKRRHELLLLGDGSSSHRSVLTHYTAPFLDQISVVLLSVTIISYVMYTLTSETAALVGSERLSYSTVFVLYGVFRYLYLVHDGDGGNPAETLVTDRALLLDVSLWLVYCGWILYRPF